jgi:hypothetical protein
MPERRRYQMELSCGRTVELRFRRLARDGRGRPERDGALYRCASCLGDRVQVIACGRSRAGWVECERRCPDCEALDAGAWPLQAFDAYELHLRTALEGLAAQVDRLEAERMASFAEVFARALRADLIEPEDFAR